MSVATCAQTLITGRVTDDQGQTLPGVNVLVKGTTQGVVTDTEGKFALQNVPDNAVLVFSFIGFKTVEVTWDGQTDFQIALSPDIQTLEEVVVVGYGTQRKSVATAALSKVDAKDLGGFAVPRLDNILQG